jgi:hypothetical protein
MSYKKPALLHLLNVHVKAKIAIAQMIIKY